MKPSKLLLGLSLSLFSLFVGTNATHAQEAEQFNYSLQQCIDYAVANNEALKNAMLDKRIAHYLMRETRAQGLPQVDATVGMNYNYRIPVSPIPAQFFDSAAPAGQFVGVQFSPKATSNGQIQLTQLIFDGRYITALQAARVYRELAEVSAERSRVEIVTKVSKAYYAVLVNNLTLNTVRENMVRLKRQLDEVAVQRNNGFAEQIDVDRLQVAYNNLEASYENSAAQVALTSLALKFQMGMPLLSNLVLTDTLQNNAESIAAEALAETNVGFKAENRIEYRVQQQNIKLSRYDVKQYQSGYLPSLVGYANYGYNTFGANVGELYRRDFTFTQGAVGLQLNIPIFDGLAKSGKIQQARLRMEKLQNDLQQSSQAFELEYEQARVSFANAIRTLEIQKRNIALAENVYRVAEARYKQGVGTNLEVIDAESRFREAQSDYNNAILNVYVARIDLKAANGSLVPAN